MKTVTMFNTESFVIVSLGNGFAYEFVNKPLDPHVVQQNAEQFSDKTGRPTSTLHDQAIEARFADLWEITRPSPPLRLAAHAHANPWACTANPPTLPARG